MALVPVAACLAAAVVLGLTIPGPLLKLLTMSAEIVAR
jgi:hypothetical protein